MSFYSDKSKAALLAGVDELNIIDEMQETVDTWVDTNIKWDGFKTTEDRVEYVDINKIGQTQLVLKYFPVVSVSQVIDNSKSSNAVELNTESYVFDSDSGILQLLNAIPEYQSDVSAINFFTKGYDSVKITYVSGYNEIPDVIVKLATAILAKWAKIKGIQANNETANLKSMKIADYTETYDLSFMNVRSEFDVMIDNMIKRAKAYYADGV